MKRNLIWNPPAFGKEGAFYSSHHAYEPDRTFAVVRDPIDRFVSGYIDRCVDGRAEVCDERFKIDFRSFVQAFIDYMLYKHRGVVYFNTPFRFKTFDMHFTPQSLYCPIREVLESNVSHVIRFCHGSTFAEGVNTWLQQENIDPDLRRRLVSAVNDTDHRGVWGTFVSPKRQKVEQVLQNDPALFRSLLAVFYDDYQVVKSFFPLYDNFDEWKQNCCHC